MTTSQCLKYAVTESKGDLAVALDLLARHSASAYTIARKRATQFRQGAGVDATGCEIVSDSGAFLVFTAEISWAESIRMRHANQAAGTVVAPPMRRRVVHNGQGEIVKTEMVWA
jgi:hypothetical protein